MRADRLLSILLLLQSQGRVTASTLADKLEVSDRTIYRDIEALSTAGVPVYMERGSGGGVFLSEEYKTGITGKLTEQEIQSLFISPNQLLTQLGLSTAFRSAILKLLNAIPMGLRPQMQSVTERVYIGNAGWNRKDEPVPCLKTVQEAVFNDKYIRFQYRKSDEVSERTAAALGLVSKGTIWYMVAEVDGKLRSYRVSRIENAEVLRDSVSRPIDFRLDDFWKQSVASISTHVPRYPVLLLCAPELVPKLSRLGHWSRIDEIGEPDETGWYNVSMFFESHVDAKKCVLENSPNMKIVEPVELKQDVVAALMDSFRLYE
ncbi:YafY family protein [Alicyclobacillus sp. SO9]|uniref:helix-turn-helix transcriptional regulator n=1 Tax=Alicyclobacillus sp. SO9 TaxID=2665646 RepID=UPI0018E83FCA|nr:WYL domain-containing protein [Alicyclobacillus sp. SO9]QQE79217.1 WYL domain-containing protein [Alicyclobacillus sp. SO9]